MTRFLGVLILAATVVLLGHPGFSSPQFAMGPLLFVLIPVLSFYTTLTPPEPVPCSASRSTSQVDRGECPERRRYPLQL